MAATYGEWLKEAREAKGWTQERLAKEALMSRSMIAAIETGRRYPSETDALALDRALGTGTVLTTFRPGRAADKGPHWFESCRVFEHEAVMIREFAPCFVPGILQTERHADAVLRLAYPPMDEEQRHKNVVTRIKRGAILEDPVSPVVWALLDEGVLKRPYGGPAVMAEQLHHLADLTERQRIRVHILPFGAGAPLLGGMVSLMWFKDQPPIAYTEALRTGVIHDSPAEVELIQGAYDVALSDARSLEESLAILRSTAEEYEKHV
ncbi:helix-turn-helix transcriptional regulator [Streptomyces sp. HSW2009]|uniref:helix-turn-helix domain-containing protein n=1 Tax=Streptomyces sp. HSW2009 TaxID=3142890 RepID=UPI0032ECE399